MKRLPGDCEDRPLKQKQNNKGKSPKTWVFGKFLNGFSGELS
jgi:hypothetical protein